MQKIHYEVSFDSPQTHLFQVTCHISQPDTDGQIISLPAWIPGSYLIRDFSRHIVSIDAFDKQGTIAIHKLDKQTWQCEACNGPLTIRYSVYAYDLSVRTAYLDTTRGYFNGSSLFVQVKGYEKLPCSISIKPPGKAYKSWRVATAMPATKTNSDGFGQYQAENYAALIDYPVELGEFSVGEFKAGGKPHRIIISGRHRANLKQIVKDLKALCNYHIDFFGEAPFERYDFLLYAAGDDQYGGLEHSNSTSLICPRNWLPVKGETTNKQGYQDFLGLCSHEYFHAWHVKRIKPIAFAETDLRSEAYTKQLWIFEGFTAYYDSLALVKSGLISREDYLNDLAKSITRFLNTPGREVQALVDSSFDAWIKLYKPDENTPNSQVSYYLKGSLVALLLDLSLRKKGLSLDVVMRQLWQEHKNKPLPEDTIELIIKKLGGAKIAKQLDAMLRDTDALPFASSFSDFGIGFELEISGNSDGEKLSDLGFKVGSGSDAKIATVYSNTAAEDAGLAGGDVIIAVNHLRVNAKTVENTICKTPAGTKLILHVFRRDELLTIGMTTQAAKANGCKLALKMDANKKAITLRDDWLQGTVI